MFGHSLLAAERCKAPALDGDGSGGAAAAATFGEASAPAAAPSFVNRSANFLCNFLGIKTPKPAAPPASSRRGGGGGVGGMWGRGRKGPPPPCPFYKKMPGTPFTVDAFRYGVIGGCSAYFLTHFHSDHYGGLTKKLGSQIKIYCNEGTANLVEGMLKVPRSSLHTLPMKTPTMVMGVEVTLLDANHCPGAAIFIFKLANGQTYLHTGDFRANTALAKHPLLQGRRIDVLYLDTTYCDPQYRFPEQQKTLDYIALTSRQVMAKRPSTLIVVGTYGIGKERVFMAIAKALGCKACVEPRKLNMLRMVAPELIPWLTTDKHATPLHVLPIYALKREKLNTYLKKFPMKTHLACYRPTGWTHSANTSASATAASDAAPLSIRPSTSGYISTWGVPYSEHSSFSELEGFVRAIKPVKIIPTVNMGNPEKREQMQKHFKRWLQDKPADDSRTIKAWRA